MHVTQNFFSIAVLSVALGISACGTDTDSGDGSKSGNADKTGVIRSLSGDGQSGKVNVDGTTYSYTSGTFSSDDASAPAVGMVVSVESEGDTDDNGDTKADKITYDAKIEGMVTANNLADGGDLEVMGQVVIVDPATVFESEDTGMTVDTIPIGAFVEVSGMTQDDGSVLASRIEVEDEHADSEEDDMELEGVITAVGADNFSIGNMMFMVDANTEFDDDLTLTTLAEGMMVEVKFVMDGDSALAVKVEAEDMHDEDEMDDGDSEEEEASGEEEVEGEVTAVDASSITVDGMQIMVDSMTIFDGGDMPFTLADIQVGDIVEVYVMDNGNGGMLAIKIELEHDEMKEEEPKEEMPGDEDVPMDPPATEPAPTM